MCSQVRNRMTSNSIHSFQLATGKFLWLLLDFHVRATFSYIRRRWGRQPKRLRVRPWKQGTWRRVEGVCRSRVSPALWRDCTERDTFRKRSANLGWCVPSCNMSVLYMVALRSLLRRSCMVLPISQISSSTSSNSLCSQDLASFHSTALLEHVQAVVWLALRFQRRREATPFGKACILSTARLPRYLTLAQRRLK